MNAQYVWQFIRRWLWLFVSITLLAGVGSYVYSSRLPRVYQGTAKLLVAPAQSGTGRETYNDLIAAERLARTYSEVLKTRPVVEAAAREVGLEVDYEAAVRLLDVRPVRDTQLIQVSALGAEPELAAGLANGVIGAFIRQAAATQSSRFTATKDILSRQVDELAAAVTQRARRVEALRAQPPAAARDTELLSLQADLTQLQQSHAAAVRSFEEVRMAEARSSDLLTVIEPASPSPLPVQPRVRQNVLVATVVGLIVAAGIAFLVEQLDDRLFSTERVTRFTGLQTLGTVEVLTEPGGGRRKGRDRFPAPSRRHSALRLAGAAAPEAFGLLRANLRFAAVENPLRTLVVTSTNAGDGKSTTAANLALAVAAAGEQVVLIDGDLRQPSLHTLFGVANSRGLTSLLVDPTLDPSSVLLPTHVDGLRLMPSGPLPPSPSALLGSERMRARLADCAGLAGLIIIDSPPTLPVSDPAILAGQVDGTLFVVDARRTRGHQAAQAAMTLKGAGANLLGAVLNMAPRRGSQYYGHYGPTRANGANASNGRGGSNGTGGPNGASRTNGATASNGTNGAHGANGAHAIPPSIAAG
ncbi:MAG: polysaccharide biosynthesis tyrosine autokinase [Chloroflexota bacterium]|nr:polysaccharide biosynthesis tyrosine autokinase [Chloroflexota bacterium]